MSIKKDYNFSYKKSGINVKKADDLIRKAKPLISSTNNKKYGRRNRGLWRYFSNKL